MHQIITDSKKDTICPCGCGNPAIVLTGKLSAGGIPYQSYLLTEDGVANTWTRFVSGPWPGEEMDCMIVFRSIKEGGGIRSYLEDCSKSPWNKADPIPGLKQLTADEIRSFEDGRNWVFDQWELMLYNQEDIFSHMKPDA